jgi:putative transposase
MANTYLQIYIQAVFAVKLRDAVIDKIWKDELHGVIGNLINETGCKTIIVNGVYDHVHCFFGLKPTISVSDLMQTTKAKSSKWINDHHKTKTHFEWQGGFGAFSYGRSQIDDMYQYILNQETHHQKQTFREEYLNFLNKFEMPYDERYIFEDLK